MKGDGIPLTPASGPLLPTKDLFAGTRTAAEGGRPAWALEGGWYPASMAARHFPPPRRSPGPHHSLDAHHCLDARHWPADWVYPATADQAAADAAADWAVEVAAVLRIAAGDSAESAVSGAEAAAAGASSSSAAHTRAGLGSSGPNSRRW